MRRTTAALTVTMTILMAMAGPALAATPYDTDPRWKAARVDGGRVGVVIELSAEPTARTYARAVARAGAVTAMGIGVKAQANVVAQRQLAQVEAAQQALLPALAAPEIGAEVIYRVQRVYDGIAAYVDPARVDAIRALPGVHAVHPLIPDRMMTSTSVPWIGAPQVWQGIGNVTGTGISIGIIDSGIDYLHKDFGGTGNYAGQNYADNTVPWTAKVVGGYDFAGDSYTGSNTPKPDGDPMDLASVGHGTHVAGIAAGYGIDANGNTFTGPWTSSADYSLFLIGPGVAPGAKLYAIRIFGSGLSTGLTTKGIDWAVDPNGDGDFSDHLDVINLSLGTPFGDTDSATVDAVENATAAGVIVVCAAGNENDTTYIVAAPGVAPHAISVAATADSGNRFAQVDVTSPGELHGTLTATAAAFGGATDENGLSGTVAQTSPNDACSAITNGADLAGKIALIDRGTCTFVTKVKAAQNAGAIGAIVVNNTSGLITMAGIDPTITIPAVFIYQSDGATLKTWVPSGSVQVTISLLTLADTVAPFSSRGPMLSQEALKPDIAAPGYLVSSAEARGGDTAVNFGGTSMATPHVAGAMALLKQLHPSWTPSQLKALAMNTAKDLYANINQQPPVMGPQRVGGGELYLPTAASSSVIAHDADRADLVSLSFGAFEVSGTTTLTKSVTVENLGGSDQTFAVGYRATSDVSGVDITFPDGPTVSVPAGGTATFRVQLDATATAMDHGTDPAADPTMDNRPRQLLGEEAGYVTLTPESGTALRVPLYAAPRPAAALGTVESELLLGAPSGTLTLNLAGTGLDTGASYPSDIVSLVTPLELQYSAASVSGPRSIRYAGVASDWAAAGGGSIAATTLEFGVALAGDWPTMNDLTVEIDIDTNRDGTWDYRLQQIDSSSYAGADTPSDAFGVELCPTGGACTWVGYVNRYAGNQLDTVVFGTNVVVLPVSASAIGLSSGNTAFKYRVVTTTPNSGSVSDTVTYDVANPGLAPLSPWFGPAPEHPGDLLQLAYNRSAYAANASKGLLLLHHHNGSGARAQVVPVTSGDCELTCSATGSDSAAVGSPASFDIVAFSTCAGTPSFDWDFGDGTAHGNGASTSHAYSVEGSYAWRLTASAKGLTCAQTGNVDVHAVTHPIHRRPLQAVK